MVSRSRAAPTPPPRGEPITPSQRALVEDLKRAIGAHGCGCGAYAMRPDVEWKDDQGVVHRCNRPCYRDGESKQKGVMR